ncbi:cell division protein FtsQ/DivIB [Hahella ganghwensis]|uniref:cell division protein FtsQ/DivIB n=1 Tax=Hahella ganghwensis TaxID=286420 RepID=UPI0003738011|nr:cell division protein FtsQ/DivIB [Hahella ganghwensis]
MMRKGSRNTKVSPRRGASAAPSKSKRPSVGGTGIGKKLARLPWAKMGIHVGIFVFWLALLSGFSYGVGWLDQPITKIEVAGDLVHTRKADVEAVLAANLQKSFFTVDLVQIREQLEQAPWTRVAAVSRKWPSTLRVQLVEEEAVARWNQDGFINVSGQVFRPEQQEEMLDLPQLAGPEHKAGEVFNRFNMWRSELNAIGLEVSRVSMESRGAWRIGFSDGWELNLGKQDVEDRLNRFTTLFVKKLHLERERIAAVDARYTRGVAVTWKETDTPESS